MANKVAKKKTIKDGNKPKRNETAKKALVIVESPSKAKTIQKYLGRDFIVKASVGHIKDLPKSKLGVDPDKGFVVDYQVIPSKKKVIDELHKAFSRVPTLYLATDPDREGEAIAWHIQDELKAAPGNKGKKIYRILLNAITKPAIQAAIQEPTTLNTDKFNAQQARRILDRLVGYKISPLLWDKVRRGLSAGRVQSVALRLIVEREKEISIFKPEEFWDIEALFKKASQGIPTRLFKVNGENPELPDEKTTTALITSFEKSPFSVTSIERKERQRRPVPPYITSRLQQDGARKLGFSAKKTMMLAQRLYEGVDLGDLGTSGLITYMRTDSVRIEPGALEAARSYILEKYGKEFLPETPNFYKSRKGAQDAHEAIRPTTLDFPPERVKHFLDKDEYRLYALIWNRFLSSQMTPAIYDQTVIDIEGQSNKNVRITFRATGSIIKFQGFMALYLDGQDEGEGEGEEKESILQLQDLKEGDAVKLAEITPSQHFTQPPPRYTDASLIKELEEKGIGRPSTYASILSNLQDREYVERRENKYFPSELGQVVTDLLVDAFPEYLNVEFTAGMENSLDEIEEGRMEYKQTLKEFWKPFEKVLEKAKKHMKNVKAQEIPTDIKCSKCNNTMIIKWGKMGSFLACSNYPECKNTMDYKKDEQGKIVIVPKEITDKICEKCSNPMIVKSGKFGKFLACSDYPNCKSTLPFTIGIACPVCKEGEMAQKQSRYGKLFYSCNKWPKCSFAAWDKPVEKPCPQCKFPILTEKTTKRAGFFYKCPNKECNYIEIIDPDGGKEKPTSEPAA